MKIAVNRCYGGFSVSKEVLLALGKLPISQGYIGNEDFGIENDTNFYAFRNHPRLIETLESVTKNFGENSISGKYSKLEIIDIPDDVDWYIEDDDGYETIHEKHRSW